MVCQPAPITLAVFGLRRGLTLLIEWKANHQGFHAPGVTKRLQFREIVIEAPSMQGG